MIENLLFYLWVLGLSLYVLIKAADAFILSAEKIGVYFKVPKFVIGATIVALGTSLPELITAIYAVAVQENATAIVVGNVVGSNICNVLLILGLSVLVAKKIKITYKNLFLDLAILIIITGLLSIFIFNLTFELYEGLIFLGILLGYYIYLFQAKETELEQTLLEDGIDEKVKIDWKTFGALLASGVFIFLGSKYTVDSVVELAKLLHISEAIIAVTAIALGTSLPELAVSFQAIKNQKNDMLVGNIIGSNILNILAVMGFPALISTLVIPIDMIYIGLPFLGLATILLFLFSLGRAFNRIHGFVFFSLYVIFIGILTYQTIQGITFPVG